MTQCIVISPKRSGHNFIKRVLMSWRPDLQVRDMENMRPNRFPRLSATCSGDTIYVIATRDLLNWTASTIRQHRQNGRLTHSRMNASVMHWYRITREYCRETDFTDQRPSRSTMLRILYDRFVVDRAYRQHLCAAINGVYTECALHDVPGGGGGSSFDGFTYQGRAEQMATLTRYLELDELELHYMKALWRIEGLVPFYRRLMHPGVDKVEFLRQTHKIII